MASRLMTSLISRPSCLLQILATGAAARAPADVSSSSQTARNSRLTASPCIRFHGRKSRGQSGFHVEKPAPRKKIPAFEIRQASGLSPLCRSRLAMMPRVSASASSAKIGERTIIIVGAPYRNGRSARLCGPNGRASEPQELPRRIWPRVNGKQYAFIKPV